MATFNPAARQTYTAAQIQAYFERIQLPKSQQDTKSLDLAFLALLQRHQLANVPFENLALHYSFHHSITLDPLHVFEKIVERNAGRGGYCMENSCLFGTVLRSLGFDVVSIGAKVNEAVQAVSANKGWKGPKYDGWNHMLNIVTIEGKKYIVDVGFGSSGPTHPLPLIENEISTNVGDQEMRLLHDTIPDFTQSRQKLWIYQHRNGIDRPWLPTYAFSEMEFTPSDFEMMNYFTSSHRTSFFTYSVVCVKMILDEGEIVGDITLFGGEVKRRIKGKSEVLAICKGEEDRVKALEEFLGIKLSAAEREGIRGMPTELLDA